MSANNVFVSYKYADSSVRQFVNSGYRTTVRDYVDVISRIFDKTDRFYFRGENDGEDLSGYDYKTIERKLADRMFYTSVTIVLISPRMFENVREIEQWIPWEISYSLKNKTRSDGSSNMNVILAVVLPDIPGAYRFGARQTDFLRRLRYQIGEERDSASRDIMMLALFRTVVSMVRDTAEEGFDDSVGLELFGDSVAEVREGIAPPLSSPSRAYHAIHATSPMISGRGTTSSSHSFPLRPRVRCTGRSGPACSGPGRSGPRKTYAMRTDAPLAAQ